MKGGQLVDVLNRIGGLDVDNLIPVYYQICAAVKHLHKQQPPIIHRDLKVTMIHIVALVVYPISQRT